jgi:Cys-rich protein (TIGR01571 family)
MTASFARLNYAELVTLLPRRLNNKRGLNRSFSKNLLFFFIFGFLFYYVGIIGGVVAILRWCPEIDVARDLGSLNYTDYQGACREAIKINYFIRLIAIPAYIILVVIASKRRGHIREKFGIPGSSCGDCCTWFWCSSCALAQETRTLMHNNVFGGHWLGPVDAATLRVQEADRFLPPQPVGGMV